MRKNIFNTNILDDDIYTIFTKISKKDACFWACDCIMRIIIWFKPIIPDDTPYESLKASYEFLNDNIKKKELYLNKIQLKECIKNQSNIRDKKIAIACLQLMKTFDNKKMALKVANTIIYVLKYIDEETINEEKVWQKNHLKEIISKK